MKRQVSRKEFIKGKTTIEDPILEPYFILKGSQGEYQICLETTSKGTHHFSNGGNKAYVEVEAYITKFDLALKYILKHKTGLRQRKNYASVNEYVGEYRALLKEMEKFEI